MAVDVRDTARREGALQGSPDPAVMQKLTIIVGGALLFLAAVKFGFLKRVMP